MRRNYSSRSTDSKRQCQRYQQGNHQRQDRHFSQQSPTQGEACLYPGSVAKVFHDLLLKNSNVKTYDETFFKLQSIMKATFKNAKPVNRSFLRVFNERGSVADEPIVIKADSFDAETWADLYVRSIPDLKLPAYSVEWFDTFSWVFANVRESVDAIDRSKWITETRTRDEEGELERSHDDYERVCAERKEQRGKIVAMLTDIIKNNHEQRCVSVEEPLEVPMFSGPESVYMFYSLRLAWLIMTMHGNHINFGSELNQFTIVINISKRYSFKDYITRMAHLRSNKILRNRYGPELCDVLAKLIEETFMYHHSEGVNKGNVPLYAKNMIDHVVDYLDVHGKVIPKKRVFGNPLQNTLRLLKNRYSGNLKTEVTALLQTYPKEVLEAYLLDSFVGNSCLTDCMYDSFLLMHKLYDLPTIKQAIVGGFCGRKRETKIHQLAYAMVIGVLKPNECLFDDSFLPAEDRIESLIIALEGSPVDTGRSIYEGAKDILMKVSSEITKRQAFRLIDCCEKIKQPCPQFITDKTVTDK